MSHANLSRRAIMSGAAALPAVAVLPMSAIASIGNPDAELLRLGADFEPIIHEWAARRAIELRHGAAWEAACIRAGLPDIEFGSIPDDEWRAYQDKRGKVRTEYSAEQDAAAGRPSLSVLVVVGDLAMSRFGRDWERTADALLELEDQFLASSAGVGMPAVAA